MNWSWFDDRPLVVAIAGPNGAGKTTFYHAHVAPAGLRQSRKEDTTYRPTNSAVVIRVR